MKKSKKLWRSLLFLVLLAALCGSFAFPVINTSVSAAPQIQVTSCSGSTLAEWTFENVTTPSTGTGIFNTSSGLPAPTFAGGNPGQAVSYNNWTTSTSLDANYYVEFVVSTVGTSTISLNFDYRATGTGPQNLQIHYSTDGGTNFVLLGSPIPLTGDSSFHSLQIDFATEPILNDNANAVFRIYGYAATGAGGTWRLDNVVFCGSPIVTIDSVVPNPTNSGTTVTWHSLVNGDYELRLGSTDCIDGTLVDSGPYTTSPATVSFSINGSALVEGANIIRVCMTDADHLHFAVNSVTKDTTAPTVTINQAAGQADPASALPINFAVVFSEAIDPGSFTVSDITQTGTATGITWSIINSGNPINFTLRATAVTGAGTLIPSIAAGTVMDLVGTGNTASTSTDNTVTYTPVAPLTVIINEVAWSGTVVKSDDEWIELYNPGSSEVNITGWQLYGDDNTVNKVGSPNFLLTGTIPAGGYFLLERDEPATDVPASQTPYATGDLVNTGERLYLKDSSGNIIDTANLDGGAWPAGTAAITTTSPPAYASMERVGTANQWVTYGGTIPVAHDRNGGPIKGTPGRANWIKTASVTTITSDTPDPSLVNQNVTVTVTVLGGTTTPTGTVSISGANTNCTITLSGGTGSCAVKFTSVGTKTLTATYTSTSGLPVSNDTESHQVSTTIVPFRTPTPIPAPPPQLVAINEFVPRPGHDWNLDGTVNVQDEYIELLNHGTVDVNLSGYSLDDEVNIGSDPYRLPAVVIRPGERIVFYGSETGLLLSDAGDGVRLLKPNGQLMDAYNYFVVGRPDQAYCRLPDDGGADDWNKNCYPTPGLKNSLSGSFVPPSNGASGEPFCPIADTLPNDFVFAECDPFGINIWRPAFWDRTGWYDEKFLPDTNGKWPVFVD